MRVYIESESDRIASYQMLLEPFNPNYQFLRYGFGLSLCSTMVYLDLEPNQFQEIFDTLPSCEITQTISGGGAAKVITYYELRILDEGRDIRL